jgi:multidrug transporter EmrE-like cation transporter
MTRPLILLILASVMVTALAQIVLKAGMTADEVARSFANGDKWVAAATTITNPLVLLGLGMYVGGAAIWLVVLARVEVSLAYPFVGLGFIVTMLLGWQFYGDNLTVPRVVGTVMIAAGVALLARS